MGRRIRQNLASALPVASALAFWLAIADNYQVVVGSRRLMENLSELILVLTYGFLAMQAVVLIAGAFISVLMTLLDIRGRLDAKQHAGWVFGILLFLAIASIAFLKLRMAMSPFHLLLPRFVFPMLGFAFVGWILGRWTGAYVGSKCEPGRWPRFLGHHYALTTGAGLFAFGALTMQYRGSPDGAVVMEGAAPAVEHILYYPIFIILGAAAWGILRAIFMRLSVKGGGPVVGLIALIIIGSFALFARPRPPNDPDRHNSNPANRGRNVVLISIDTLRYDRLGCNFNAYIQTSNIDSLAAESVVFDNCIVPMPVTVPSHYSMLTGLTPRHHGVRDQVHPLDSSFLTLAERLSAEGFTCGGFISMSFMTAKYANLGQGFHYFDDFWVFRRESRFFPRQIKYLYSAKVVNKIITGQTARPNPYERKAETAVKSVLRWLEYVKDEDFFCFLHLFDPHGTYNAPEPYTEMYYPGYDGVFREHPNPDISIREEQIKFEQDDIDFMIARYDGEVTYVDAQLARLFERLKELGLWDETLIILTSDHGESFAHDYFFSHHDRVYQSCIHVPLLVKPFGGAGGDRCDALCSTTDFIPTVCDMLSIGMPEGLDGKSLVDFIDGSAGPGVQPHAYLFSESYPFKVDVQSQGKQYSINRGKYKLIHSPYAFPYVPLYRLYDLSVDPGEEHDIRNSEPVLFKQLANLLDKWVREDESVEMRVTGRIREENLRSLQYLN